VRGGETVPVYEARLEAQDESGEFRVSTIQCHSKGEAFETLLSREEDYELFRLDRAEIDQLAAEYGPVVEEILAGDTFTRPGEAALAHVPPVTLPPTVSARLALHQQTLPYKLVSLKEVKN
jgi:hypothetical protein